MFCAPFAGICVPPGPPRLLQAHVAHPYGVESGLHAQTTFELASQRLQDPLAEDSRPQMSQIIVPACPTEACDGEYVLVFAAKSSGRFGGNFLGRATYRPEIFGKMSEQQFLVRRCMPLTKLFRVNFVLQTRRPNESREYRF